MIFHEIVCRNTILVKYHTLFYSKLMTDVAKFVVCCSRGLKHCKWTEFQFYWVFTLSFVFCCCFLCPQRNFGRHIVIALSVRPSVRPSVSPSVRPASCPVHISYILSSRNSKFGVWMHLGMTECRVPFSGHCDLDLDL